MTTRPPRILAVCLGNICRSPTAEAALREAADAAGVEVEVDSAGTGDWHIGEPPDPRMTAAAAAVGLDLGGTAAQVDASALADADLVLAMDTSTLRKLEHLAETAGVSTRIVRYRDLDPAAGDAVDVPDPYYGGDAGFAEVVTICRRTARNVIEVLPDLLASDHSGAR